MRPRVALRDTAHRNRLLASRPDVYDDSLDQPACLFLSPQLVKLSVWSPLKISIWPALTPAHFAERHRSQVTEFATPHGKLPDSTRLPVDGTRVLASPFLGIQGFSQQRYFVLTDLPISFRADHTTIGTLLPAESPSIRSLPHSSRGGLLF